MFLSSLSISHGDETVRKIEFHSGLNLIVDVTRSDRRTETGNNVGKTTVLRLINFCLGGSGESIYKDKEFRDQSNVPVEAFLTRNNIIIQLELVDDLESAMPERLTIRKNFLKYSSRILEVNGNKVKVKDFDALMKRLVFGFTKDKPTFKQIISKNIRDDENRLANTLRVLNSFTSKDEYEALYLFWLGIDLDSASRKQELIQHIKAEEKLRHRLEVHTSIAKIRQFLVVVGRNIRILEERKKTFNLNENYEDSLRLLTAVKLELNRKLARVNQLELRQELN